LNFFKAQQPSGCANSAYNDVIYHEYGHAIDDQLGGILDGGYSEGFGDTMALLITRQPIVGRDFFGPGHHLRPANNAPNWPAVQNGEVHQQGWAYSGFVWQLITKLVAKYGNNEDVGYMVAKRLLLSTGVQNPRSVPDAVRLTFFVDAQLFPGGPGQKSKHYD